ncbi:MAG TPA: transposase [Phototrophicaceae bacterium]|nr:transposase [Phototrophicaceae bacterium]
MLNDMRLTFKYRLRPTKRQASLLNEQLEICRSVYNSTLAVRKDAYRQHDENLNYYKTAKLLPLWKINFCDMAKVHSQVLQNVQIRVDLAFQAFFRRVKSGEKPGYPRFKGKGRYHSITYPQYGNGVKLVGNVLTLSKIGDVFVKLHRPVEGKIKTVTVHRDTVGKWYVHFSCLVEAQPLEPTLNIIGVDLGLKTFATLSDGCKIARQRWVKRDAADIARLQRKKERCAKGSPERRKVIHALRHAYQRANNRRANFAHQESRKLVNTYQFIAFEKLDVQSILSQGNRTLNRNIADAAWEQFVSSTVYKAENAGRTVVLVNPHATTQECSGCGAIVHKDLNIRIHECPHCGLKLDRDLNAALNILARGLASIGQRAVEAPAIAKGRSHNLP